MTATTPALSLEAMSFRVGGATIVDRVSLQVTRGELIGIIGPNGAGKTTLLNLLSGTVRSSSGRILMDGRDVTRAAPHRRARLGLSRTFQTSYLLLGLTALENVRLMAQVRTVRGPRLLRLQTRADPTVAEAQEALGRVGLGDRTHVAAGSLSHGDRRKLELAIVLAARAPFVLLDEPIAGVNTEDIDDLTTLIRDLHRETGATFLMVEHHLDVVLDLADRVAVMDKGQLIALDQPSEVIADARVQAAYVGEIL